MEYEEVWWSPQNPEYQEARTVELINLFQQELKDARAALGESEIGYKYSDGTMLKIFWETPEYLGDEAEDSDRDVVYRLHGKGFGVECRISGPNVDENTMIYGHVWGEIIEEHLWIDGVYGDDVAKAWLRNPPERSIIDAESYVSRPSA